MPLTHDVGSRISWTLRPPVSEKIDAAAKARGQIVKATNDIEFDDELEFTYYFLLHHEGRRARHGVAMMGADYTQWHGNYEVAHRFYMEFVPQLKEVLKRVAESGDAAKVAAAKNVAAELEKVSTRTCTAGSRAR